MLAVLSARCTTLEEGRIATIEAMEEMFSLKHSRDIATKRLEVDLNYKAATFDKLAPVIPIVINKFLARSILPEDPAQLDALEALILNLKESQIADLQKVLTPEQTLNFVKLWEGVAKRVDERAKKEAAAKAEREKSTNGTTSAKVD